MTAPFERGAVVRRAEEHQLGQRRSPSVLHLHGVVMGAARYQTAHAVADDDQLVDRHRPLRDQFFEQLGEVLPALGNVTSAVVVQVDRREAEIACQRLAVIVAVARPLQVVHAQAVRQHQELAARRCDTGRQPAAREFECLPADAQRCLNRERVVARGQVIAPHTVEHRERHFTRR